MGRFILLVVLELVGMGFVAQYDGGPATEARRDLYLAQLRNDDAASEQIRVDYTHRHTAMALGQVLWGVLAVTLYSREIRSVFHRSKGVAPTSRPDVA